MTPRPLTTRFPFLLLTATLASGWILLGCEKTSSSGAEELDEVNTTQDAAILVGGALALESGGLLEGLENALDEEAGGLEPAALEKSLRLDEAIFDSSACLWTLSRTRSGGDETAGFTHQSTRTTHMFDAEGGCVVQRGDSLIRGMDLTRQFAGSRWNPRRHANQSGGGEWTLGGLHDGEPGEWASGVHHETGDGVVHRVRPNGDTLDVEYEYELTATSQDLLLVRRDGRRVPVAGTLHVVYDALRNGRNIHREFTVEFGTDGGTLSTGDYQRGLDPVSGELGD